MANLNTTTSSTSTDSVAGVSTTGGGTNPRIGSGINVVLGIWLVITAFTLSATDVGTWNTFIAGIAVAVLSLIRMVKPTVRDKVLSWINVILGVWLVISPFILGYVARGEIWNSVIAGVLIAIFAAWSAGLPRLRA